MSTEPQFLCNQCQPLKNSYTFLRKEIEEEEGKEEEIECYYCLKKYDEHVQAQILFNGKPSCINCKQKDAQLKYINYQDIQKAIHLTPNQEFSHKKNQMSGQLLYSGDNTSTTNPSIQISQQNNNNNQKMVTPRGQRTQTSQFLFHCNSGNQQDSTQSPQVQQAQDLLQPPQRNRRVTLSPNPYGMQGPQMNNQLDQIRESGSKHSNEEQQSAGSGVQQDLESQMQNINITPIKGHHRSQTLQNQAINSNTSLMQKGQQLKEQAGQNLVDYVTFNENQKIQKEQQEKQIDPVVKHTSKEQRVLKLLSDFKENGVKYLTKKCIFKYSDYKNKGLVSQKFKEKCDKKSNLVILIQCHSGLLFGTYISEVYDKKQKNTVVDKLSVCFSSYGVEPVFYPVANNKIVMNYENGIQIGKPESLTLNFDQLNQSKCTYSMCYDNPLGGEQIFKISWNTSWTNMVQDIYVFKM